MRIQPLLRAFLFSLLLAIVFAWPLLTQLSATGKWDWSEAAATYESARHTIFLYGQFPLWNPYMCGGYPALGNPQTYWLSPTFLFVLLFGTTVGVKLAVVPYIWGGVFGTWLLARRLGIGAIAALAAGPIYLTSGFLGMHLSGGQFLWLTLAWVPWVFYGYLRGQDNWRWLILGAGSLTMIGLAGRANLVAYVVIMMGVYALVADALNRQFKYIPRAIILLVLAFGFGAWKFLPDLKFMTHTVLLPEVAGIGALPILKHFFIRDVSFNNLHSGVSEIEFSFYTGVIPWLLAVLALTVGRGRRILVPLTLAGAAMLLVALVDQSYLLEQIPVVRQLRNPQRAISLVIFVLGIWAARGLDRLPKKWQWGLLVLLLFDLLTMTSPLMAREYSKVAKGENGGREINIPIIQDEGFDPFPTVATNRGAKSFCPAVVRAWKLETPVVPYLNEDYRGEIYTTGQGQVKTKAHTPNRIEFVSSSTAAAEIWINQNWLPGWRARGGSAFRTDSGLLGVRVPAGEHKVELEFWPQGLTEGIGLSLLTVSIVLSTHIWLRVRERKLR